MTFQEAIESARGAAHSSGVPHMVRAQAGPPVRWDHIPWDGQPCAEGRVLITPDLNEFAVLDGRPRALFPERLKMLERFLGGG
jgi:hypothetical protein